MSDYPLPKVCPCDCGCVRVINLNRDICGRCEQH